MGHVRKVGWDGMVGKEGSTGWLSTISEGGRRLEVPFVMMM